MPAATYNILIDVPVAEGFARRPERRDRYETDRPFLEKVRAEYLRLWGFQGLPANVLDEFESNQRGAILGGYRGWWVINGLGTVDEVHQRILDALALAPPDDKKCIRCACSHPYGGCICRTNMHRHHAYLPRFSPRGASKE